MNLPLFDTHSQYSEEFEHAFKAFRNPRDKKDAAKAWKQTSHLRPEISLLILCIEEYLSDIKASKTKQKYFAGWLRSERWNDHMTAALARKHLLDNPHLIPKPKPSFRASEHEIPNPPQRLKPWREVLAERGKL